MIRGGDTIDFTYVALDPDKEFGRANRKAIVKDREGNVVEYYYDSGWLLVKMREFTGRARLDT